MRDAGDGASTALVAAQWAPTRVPYIDLVFHGKDGSTHDFTNTGLGTYQSRILGIDHHEEAFNDYAYIVLNDNDRAIPDLRGYYTEIGYGLQIAGNPCTYTSRMWVKYQEIYFTRSGQQVTILELEGEFAKMGETKLFDLNSGYSYQDTLANAAIAGKTIYGVIEWLIEVVFGGTLNPLGTADDGIIDEPISTITVNSSPWEDVLQVIRALLQMTFCYIRPLPSRTFEIVLPLEASPSETYYKDTVPQYYTYVNRSVLPVPNECRVWCNATGTDNGYGGITWTYPANTASADWMMGSYEDAAATTLYDKVYLLGVAPSITVQGDADNRAQLMLAKAQRTATSGRLTVAHDSRVELWDIVEVIS